MKDWQRQRVYNGQYAMRLKAGALPPGSPPREAVAPLASFDEAVAWMEALVDSEWWHDFTPVVRSVEVSRLPSRAKNNADCHLEWHTAVIRLSKSGLNPLTLMHELAHPLTPNALPSHGEEYLTYYLEIVRSQFGDETKDMLCSAFDLMKVRWARDPDKTAVAAGKKVRWAERHQRDTHLADELDGRPLLLLTTVRGEQICGRMAMSADGKTILVDSAAFSLNSSTEDDVQVPAEEAAYISWAA